MIPEESFGEGFWARCKAVERSCYLHDETVEAARFFTRRVFEQVGGFDEEIMAGAEDWDIHERVRRPGPGAARARAYSATTRDGSVCLRRWQRSSITAARPASISAGTQDWLGASCESFRPAFVRHRHLLASQPLTAAGMLFMKMCEFSAGAGWLWSGRVEPGEDGRLVRHRLGCRAGDLHLGEFPGAGSRPSRQPAAPARG